MATQWRVRLALMAAFAAMAGSAAAHHSVAGEFDQSKRATLTGTISKIDWINPHIYVYLDVPDEHGQVTTWRLETLPTAMMRKAGLNPELLMAGGSNVSAKTMPARDGTKHLGYLIKLTYEDGHYYQLAAD